MTALALLLAAPSAADGPAACRPATGTASQLITVEASRRSSTSAALRLWRRERNCWVAVAGPWRARVGRRGLSAARREGDGTTPVGNFRIGPVMYGIAPNPRVRFRYRRIVCGDYWVEDPRSPYYNTFRHLRCGSPPPFRVTGERLWKAKTAYRHFAVLEFNMRPVVPGRGSGIFLHATTGRPTNGCISLPLAQLRQTLRWLDPAARPRIEIRAGHA